MSSIWSKLINLAGNITGTLPVANGGTGITSGTSGGVLAFTASGTIASSGALTASAVVLGGGAGAAPTSLALGTANQVLGMNSGATAHEYKTMAVGTTGSDFAVANAANSVTFNLPDAGASARGAVTTGTQTMAGAKTFSTQLIGAGINGTGDAAAGYIGEYIEAVVTTSTAYGSTTGTTKSIATLNAGNLPAGDWDLDFSVWMTANGGTCTEVGVWISTTADSTTGRDFARNTVYTTGPTSTHDDGVTLAGYRVSTAGSTTYYLTMSPSFTTAAPKYQCRISARRRR